MAGNNTQFNFNISLSVLNHLGRNLYRSFITVIGEAISNSWDADAENVWIIINREENYFVIKDDGIGMTSDDFQDKFLKIGYTKRKDGDFKSPKGRPFIGRKGIGKLALLSCAKRISIISKTSITDSVGGTIDNNQLDQDINDDINPQDSKLGEVDNTMFSSYIDGYTKGTIIYFEDIHDGIKNRLDYIKTLVALYFRFSLVDKDFNIHINDREITVKELQDLADKTQFLWKINNLEDPYLDLLEASETQEITSELSVKGFIASVEKPSSLKIRTSDEKAGIDLFVNGRLREKNILSHFSTFSTRVVASYLYGQIHFDQLDLEGVDDKFTSAREGVKEGDDDYQKLLDALEKILNDISNQWDKWRNELKVIKPDVIDPSIPNFNAFVGSKKEAVNKFLNTNESEDLKEEAKKMIETISPTEKAEQKILITHSRKNKPQADIIYKLLIYCEFKEEEILYTSSDNSESKIPVNIDIFDYIKKFFVNDWFEKPHVFFIASQDMEDSWHACLEVGASWIVGNKHNIATVNEYEPKLPLNPDNYVYLVFNNNQCDENDLYEIFKELTQKFNKNICDKNIFINKFNEVR